MPVTLRILLSVTAIPAAALALSSCAAQEPDISHFERPQESGDVVEDRQDLLTGVDEASMRLLATDAQSTFYAARQETSGDLCVIEVPAGSPLPALSCTSGPTVTVHSGEVEYAFGPRSAPDDGWVELADRFWKK